MGLTALSDALTFLRRRAGYFNRSEDIMRAPVATIHRNAPDSYGIRWSNAPYFEVRGGYSGPFASAQEAIDAAQQMARYYAGTDATIRRED